MTIRRVVGLAAALLAGCVIIDTDANTEVSTGSTTTTDASSSTGAGSSSSTGVESSGSSTTGPSGPGVCRRSCELPADCCPAGQPGCPSLEYPFNYDCVGGICVPPACSTDAECEASLAGTTCHVIDGLAVCVQACDNDPDICTQPNSGSACVGMADDGTLYCMEPCTSPFIDCGVSVCDEASGLCVCENDDQCPFNFACG